jgi:16S rRNA (uracil1498-N3)-methyltransferase
MILFLADIIEQDTAMLTEDEYTHCCKVLRHKEGDIINITDGKGMSAQATITSISKKNATLSLKEIKHHDAPTKEIIIAIAPPKNRGRWEWFVEKSVELGITSITPLKTKNSERVKVNIDRSRKIMRSAALQSLRYHHPTIKPLQTLNQFLAHTQEQPHKGSQFIAHYEPDNNHLKDVLIDTNIRTILIGPEGDFTHEELQIVQDHAFQMVNISDNRLRTETAGIHATSILSL